MLAAVLDTLLRVNPELAAEEVADILWLAPYLPQTAVRRGSGQDRESQVDRKQTKQEPDRQQASQDGSTGTATKGSRDGTKRTSGGTAQGAGTEAADAGTEERSGGLYIEPGSERDGRERLPFRTPEAPALPGRLELARALRPLIAQVADPVRMRFDEEATVRRIVETDIWIPVQQPAPRARFELAIVVDSAPAMAIWQRTVHELQLMLSRHRAFSDVRVWELLVNGRTVSLRSGLAQASAAQLRWPGPLRDVQKRRLVLLLSDCVGRPWQDGTLAAALAELAAHSPLALVQLLPQHMWPRTSLGDAGLTVVSSAGSVGRLSFTPRRSRFGEPLAYSPPIPVLSLEPGRVQTWAALTSGDQRVRMPAVLLDPTPRPAPPVVERSAAQRVGDFVAGASPSAHDLASLLAAASPLNLAVARLIQRAVLPHARQFHLAEVFLSGLLQRDPAAPPAQHPDTVRYEFYPGVRALLRNALPIADAISVLRYVTAYLSGHWGAGQDFFAFLDELLVSEPVGEHELQPFAAVAADVLEGLGGRYAELAQRLATVASRPARVRSQPQPTVSTEEPPPPPVPLIVDGRELIPLEQLSVLSPQLRAKLNRYWITTVEELVTVARSSNQQYGNGLTALAVALDISETEMKTIFEAAIVLLPDNLNF